MNELLQLDEAMMRTIEIDVLYVWFFPFSLHTIFVQIIIMQLMNNETIVLIILLTIDKINLEIIIK